MPRRVKREVDIERTNLLSLDEIFVQKGKGDATHYFAWNHGQGDEICPFCGEKYIKVHNLFSKNYTDIIHNDNRHLIISLEYEFYKYRCLNKNCRHIFAKKIRFASQYDNVTYRLEDEIAKLVIQGFSYKEISDLFSDSISRQAIGQIFNRWVHKKEEARIIVNPPSSLCVISGKTDKDQYTLFLNLDDGIRVFDILYGVNSLDIVSKLREIGFSSIDTIITDCNPTINDVISDNLPESIYIIPVEYWFKLVSEDFEEYAKGQLRWRQEPKKIEVIMTPEDELTSILIRDTLLESRPELVQPYKDYNELRRIVTQREKPWTYMMINDWVVSVCEEFKPQLRATALRLRVYREAIYHHELNRTRVPDGLYLLTKNLEELISTYKTFSEEQLKARILYSVPSDLKNWRGIPLDTLIKELIHLEIKTVGGNKNEY